MSTNSISNISPSTPKEPMKAQGEKELTTITTKCNKKHNHDPSCPHTTSTRPAPKMGEKGYHIDKTV